MAKLKKEKGMKHKMGKSKESHQRHLVDLNKRAVPSRDPHIHSDKSLPDLRTPCTPVLSVFSAPLYSLQLSELHLHRSRARGRDAGQGQEEATERAFPWDHWSDWENLRQTLDSEIKAWPKVPASFRNNFVITEQRGAQMRDWHNSTLVWGKEREMDFMHSIKNKGVISYCIYSVPAHFTFFSDFLKPVKN